MNHLAISANDLMAAFQSDDVLLIRMLLTLLLIENTAIKNGCVFCSGKIPLTLQFLHFICGELY